MNQSEKSRERPPRVAAGVGAYNNDKQAMHPALLEMRKRQKSQSSKSNERLPRRSSKSNPRRVEDQQDIQLSNMRNDTKNQVQILDAQASAVYDKNPAECRILLNKIMQSKRFILCFG